MRNFAANLGEPALVMHSRNKRHIAIPSEVGAPGFEPGTFRSRRATGSSRFLQTTPLFGVQQCRCIVQGKLSVPRATESRAGANRGKIHGAAVTRSNCACAPVGDLSDG